MPITSWNQKSFATGHISPSAQRRSDLQLYNQAVKNCKNAFILPQGSIIKRWGTRSVDQYIADDITTSTIIPYDLNDDNSYIICATSYRENNNIIFQFKLIKNRNYISYTKYSQDSGHHFPFDQDLERITSLPSYHLPFYFPFPDNFDFNKISFSQFGERIVICSPHIKPFFIQRYFYDTVPFLIARELDLIIPKDPNNPTEDAWNDDYKGWPTVCAFHANRLYFANSSRFPETIWGSKVGIYNDFSKSDTTFDDDALELTFQTGQRESINSIISANHLLVFTKHNEWFHSSRPITPSNFGYIKKFSEYGSSFDVKPVAIENVIIYRQRDSNKIRLVQWDWELDTVVTTGIDHLGGDLIKDPILMSTWRGKGSLAANYVFILNSDGSVIAIGLDTKQKLLNWSLWEFPLRCKQIFSSGDDLYFNFLNEYLPALDNPSKQQYNFGYVCRLDSQAYFDIESVDSPDPSNLNNIRFDSRINYQFKTDVLYFGDHNLEYEESFSANTNSHFKILNQYILPSIRNGIVSRGIDMLFGSPIIFEVETLPIPNPLAKKLEVTKRRVLNLIIEVVESGFFYVTYQNKTYKKDYIPFNYVFNSKKPLPQFNGAYKFSFLGDSAQDSTIKIIQNVPFAFRLIQINQQVVS